MSAADQPAQPAGAPAAEPSPAASRAMMHRLDRLEHENRKLRRQGTTMLVVTAILLGVGVALVVTAARHGMPGFVPDVVEAKEFLLRDSEGRVRGAWGSDQDGAIRLVLQGDQSNTSIKLNLLADGSSGLTFTDSAGTPRLVVALLPDNTVNLVLGDQRGVARTVLGLNPNGGSTLVFADQGGTTRTGIGVDNRGRSMLSVGQESGVVEEERADTATKK
ncbi:MAG TPA: hypothetical protein VGA78_01225, partial [Gemmatimonadales bacterium]